VVTVQGKRVLVLGAARSTGIGQALVRRLARGGAALVIADSVAGAGLAGTHAATPEALAAVAADAGALAGSPVPVHELDPLDPARVAEVVATSADQLGGLDAVCQLVGATGADFGDGPLADVSPAAWQAGIAWNLTTSWLVAKAASTAMADGGGSIVLLSSYAGIDSTPMAGVVGVARAGVNHLVGMLARELGPRRIRVNSVCPLGVSNQPDGQSRNPGLRKLAEAAGMTLEQWLAATIPLGRGQSPDEVAAVFEFLVSDDSSFVSGASVPVAGGARA
jgi:NAD(P)-dependent dehydrogenase (short-subunit alcohol dehydrogenase family)